MSLLGLLLIVTLLVVLLGNPHLGPAVIQDYRGGYWPSGAGLLIAIIIIVLLLRR
jgi:hypothetical protein